MLRSTVLRASCVVCVLGAVLACSGQPFTASDGSLSGGATSGGPSAGAPPGKDGTSGMGGAASGRPGQGEGGVLVEPEPSNGGDAGDGSAGAEGSDAAAGASSAGAGASGDEDGGGEGGSGGEGLNGRAECPSRSDADWELGYFPELRNASAQESHPFFRVTNRGLPTSLDRIAIRYYFTNEPNAPETATCYWVTGNHCALTKLEFGAVAVPTPDAERYLQVTFPGASHVELTTESLEVRVGFRAGGATLIQSNDYSFDVNAASATSAVQYPYKRWLRATVYVNGDLVWGTEPCLPSVPGR